jgi:hypothetical protein
MTLLKVNRETFEDIKRRIIAIDERLGSPVYQNDMIIPAKHGGTEKIDMRQIFIEVDDAS